MNRNTTCPSACCHREPATTNASPAAFSITSRDIRTKSKLRRTSRLVSPSENKIPASISPSLMGICVMLNLRFHSFQDAQVVGAHHLGILKTVKPEIQHDTDTHERRADTSRDLVLAGADQPARTP